MNLGQAIHANFDDKEQVKEFNKFMKKIEWLNDKELSIETFEKIAQICRKKYKVRLAYIQPSSERSYSFMIRKDETNEWLETVYVSSMYEGFAKSVLIMYAHIKKGIKFQTGHMSDRERYGKTKD